MSDYDRGRGEPRSKKQKTGGFKWKERRPRDDIDPRDQPQTGLHRGYRDRSPRKDSYRERSPQNQDVRVDSSRDYDRRERSPRRDDYRRNSPSRDDYTRSPRRPDERPRKSDAPDSTEGRQNGVSQATDGQQAQSDEARPRNAKHVNSELADSTADKFGLPSKKSDKKDKPKKSSRPAVPTEEMIIVKINDRLGTTAQIPCLASDNIKLFKAQVAARIGRQPHEIMLKRQGERPFKDNLTLADYGVSNGVQLDLEIDTGD